jgi:hypothetical protein
VSIVGARIPVDDVIWVLERAPTAAERGFGTLKIDAYPRGAPLPGGEIRRRREQGSNLPETRRPPESVRCSRQQLGVKFR